MIYVRTSTTLYKECNKVSTHLCIVLSNGAHAADCGRDQRKSRQDRKRKQRQSASEGIIKKVKGDDAERRLAKQWQHMANHRAHERHVPASDKHHWQAKSLNSSSSGDLSFFLDIFVFSCQTSKFKLSTSRFTHHPRVTKARATLHPHVCTRRTLTQLATRSFWVNLHLVYIDAMTRLHL